MVEVKFMLGAALNYATTLFAAPGAISRLYAKHRTRTKLSREDFDGTIATACTILGNPHFVTSSIVECGAGRGGMAAALIHVGGKQREYYFFDTFEDSDDQSSVADFYSIISAAGLPDGFLVTKCSDKLLPTLPMKPIAVLHIDSDWCRDATTACLDMFWNDMIPGGIVLFDGYHTQESCAHAVRTFLSSHEAHLGQGPSGLAYLKKMAPQH